LLKGLFSIDFVVGLSIFIVAILLISPMWQSMNTQAENLERSRDMQATAASATDILLRTTGSPPQWNNTYVKSIGLIDSDERVLDANKSRYLFLYIESNYSDAKWRLGAGAYEMGAEIANKSGSPINYRGVTFTNNTISPDAREVAIAQRVAILKYNDTSMEFVNLKITIWR